MRRNAVSSIDTHFAAGSGGWGAGDEPKYTQNLGNTEFVGHCIAQNIAAKKDSFNELADDFFPVNAKKMGTAK